MPVGRRAGARTNAVSRLVRAAPTASIARRRRAGRRVAQAARTDLHGLEDLAEAAEDEFVFAGLHHPDGDFEAAVAEAGDGDGRVAFEELAGDVGGFEGEGFFGPVHEDVRDVVGDGGDVAFGGKAGDAGEAAAEVRDAGFKLVEFAFVIGFEVTLEGGEEADHFFLTDLHAAADAGKGVEAGDGGGDEVLAAEEDAGALGAADGLAAGEGNEVEAFFLVLEETFAGGGVGGGVEEGGDAAALGDGEPVAAVDVAVGVAIVEEEHHGGAVVDGAFEFVFGFHPDGFGADEKHLLFVAAAVRFLLDDLVLHARRVGEALELFGIALGDAGDGGHGDGGGAAIGDHGGFGAEEFGDAGAGFGLEFGEGDEVAGGVFHGAEDFGVHERTAEMGDDADAVDDGADAEAGVDVGGGGGGFRGAAGEGGAGGGGGCEKNAAAGFVIHGNSLRISYALAK